MSLPLGAARIFPAILNRLLSPHGRRFLVELVELCGRYSADFTFLDGKRVYSSELPIPARWEDYEHSEGYYDGADDDGKQLADYELRYYAQQKRGYHTRFPL